MKREVSRPDNAAFTAGVTGAVALSLCCGGGLLAAAFGFGAVAALLVNPWFLTPVVLATAGIFYWRVRRAASACDVEPPVTSDRS